MRIAYFDCQFGAAGDMLLGALLGVGLPRDAWLAAVEKIALPADSFEITIDRVSRCSIQATKVDVRRAQEQEERHLSDIERIIAQSEISNRAKTLALDIFKRLAVAEAQVHGVTPSAVHFHEVGAVDAIVDIVGFAIGYDLLGIEASYVSPLPLGSGTVSSEHGLFPVPGPAVLNLLKQSAAPTVSSVIDFECLTPTGAAILTTIAAGWGQAPAYREITATGYGAGARDCQSWPNVVRVVLGQSDIVAGESAFDTEFVAVLEANVDDMNPQALSYAVERLLDAGALDVLVLPAVMKKGRSGHMLSVVCKVEDDVRLKEVILSETSTLGVRSHQCTRLVARREWQAVQLARGTVRIKVARDRSGRITNAQPEFEDCAAYATRHGVPLKDVLTEALAVFARPGEAVK
jgi:hypothetical protein